MNRFDVFKTHERRALDFAIVSSLPIIYRLIREYEGSEDSEILRLLALHKQNIETLEALAHELNPEP